MYASDCQFVVDASWVDASGAVAQHVVIEPTGAQSSAGKTQPGTCEPTGGNLAGIQRPVAKKSLAIRPSPAKIPPPMPDPSPKSDAKPAPASIKTPATKTTKKTKPATTQAAALPKTGNGDWAVACLAFVFLGMLLVPIIVRALRGGALFANVVSAASFPHFSELIMKIA